MTEQGDAEQEFHRLRGDIALIGFVHMGRGLALLEDTKYWSLEDYHAAIREMKSLLQLNAISYRHDRGPW